MRAASVSCVICRSITRSHPRTTLNRRRGLYDAWQAAQAKLPGGQVQDVTELAAVLRDLKEPINRFFTDVLVMAEDPAVRVARLALVQRIAALPDGVADLSVLQGF